MGTHVYLLCHLCHLPSRSFSESDLQLIGINEERGRCGIQRMRLCHMGDQKGTCEGTSMAGNGQARLSKRTESLGKFWEEKIIEDQLTTLA